MDKENKICAKYEEHPVRITRARARALGSIGGIPPSLRPSFKPEQKRLLRANYKKGASDENKTYVAALADLQHKRKAALTDVTNLSEISYNKIINASKFQARRGHTRKNMKLAADVSREVPSMQEDVQTTLVEELSKVRMVESHDTTAAVRLADKESLQNSASSRMRESVLADPMLSMQDSTKPGEPLSPPYKDINMIHEKLRASDDMGIVDIDSELKDHQMSSLYASDIYNSIRVTELERRPSVDSMDKLQQDITPSMRAILIDWLVEVSEEYKLVPDTLYLTVNLIDRFLSKILIEKQRLQLLGVTCMLIASKYEEICPPRIEEFCFITDSTYARGEVLKMESEILNVLHFQLSVPTIKTFLRRFIQAAQTSDKVQCVELEYLANYLAELTLVEYSFLKFLPSMIAASAVFLARWTLNQSDHPWNPTLRHYTNYEVSDLKTTVLALEDLQLNTKGCSLNAIREKYRQQKFKCVAALSSKAVSSLF